MATDLINLVSLGFAEKYSEVNTLRSQFSSVALPVAGVLLLLGLVGLYVYQSEAAGTLGLVGFLWAFFGSALAQSFVWAYWMSALGWSVFGVSSLQTRAYPRMPTILLTISAVVTAILSASVLDGTLKYASVVSVTIFDVSVAWLGFSLFTGRLGSAQRAERYKMLKKNLKQERKRVEELMAEREEIKREVQRLATEFEAVRERDVMSVAALLLAYCLHRRRSDS